MRDIFSIAYQVFGRREKISIVPRAKRSRGTLSRRHHRRMLPIRPSRLLEPQVHQFLSWHQWHHMNFSLISFQAHLYDKSFWLTYFVDSDHYSKLSYSRNHDSLIFIPEHDKIFSNPKFLLCANTAKKFWYPFRIDNAFNNFINHRSLVILL